MVDKANTGTEATVDPKAVEKAVESDAKPAVTAQAVAKAVKADSPAAAPKKAKPAKKTAAKKAKPAKKPAAKRTPAKNSDTSKNTKPKETIMATSKTNEFSKNVQSVAADMQERMSAAYEKSTSLASEATEMARGNVEAMVESGKILASGLQEMGRGEVDYAKSAFETLTADLKAMAAVKSPTELFKLQGEIARRNFDTVVARASKNAEASMKLANEAFAPISNRVSVAVEKISKAA